MLSIVCRKQLYSTYNTHIQKSKTNKCNYIGSNVFYLIRYEHLLHNLPDVIHDYILSFLNELCFVNYSIVFKNDIYYVYFEENDKFNIDMRYTLKYNKNELVYEDIIDKRNETGETNMILYFNKFIEMFGNINYIKEINYLPFRRKSKDKYTLIAHSTGEFLTFNFDVNNDTIETNMIVFFNKLVDAFGTNIKHLDYLPPIQKYTYDNTIKLKLLIEIMKILIFV